MRTLVLVIPGGPGWLVQVDGRTFSQHETANEAISAARGLATFRFPSVVYLLGGDGHYRRVWEAEARG